MSLTKRIVGLVVLALIPALAVQDYAAKYGALSTGSGRVDIARKVGGGESGANGLSLEWRETGGTPVQEPAKRGFGFRLINGGVSRELGGEIRLNCTPKGMRCSLHVPLDGPDRFTSFVAASNMRPAGRA